MGVVKEQISLENLLKTVEKRLGANARDLVARAYKISDKMHEGQKRLSGEPYIIHPLNVAYLLSDLGLDEKVIVAGLLHDIIEDTEYTKEDMIRDFGEEVAELVEGVTKISVIKSQSKETEAAENIRKILIATIKDIRVILIKLADKTHNMRTLQFQPPEKQTRIANETLMIYAPIAGRLGIYKIKFLLEDLAFQVLHPNEFNDLKEKIAESKNDRDDYIEKIRIILLQRLSDINIEAHVEGRSKHFYSIYRKMKLKEKSFDEIFDLRALRIITNEVKDCYGVLGIVHTLWTPVPGRFKDYIATPKTNLYQSLHTTVIGPDGKPMEVQIRTNEMNRIAENGIAAHWAYKEGKVKPDNKEFTLKWLEVLKSWQDTSLDAREFIEELQYDLHEDEVFVFTPKGEIMEFPRRATILDFAFRIHTDIGLHAKGAKINGRMVPLRTELTSGDQIDIVTDKTVKPSPIWLRIVKTPSARQKLRQYFRKIKEEEPVPEIHKPSHVPEKEILQFHKKSQPSNKNKQNVKKDARIIVAGIKDIMVRISGCCSPVPGDDIVGFITRGRGVSIHKKDCDVATKMDKNRIVNVSWDGIADPIPVRIEVKARDRQGIYLEMVESISSTETNIIEAGASSLADGTLLARFRVEIEHLDLLEEILENL